MRHKQLNQIIPALCWIVVFWAGLILSACEPEAPLATPEQTVKPQETPTQRISPPSTRVVATPASTPEPDSVIAVGEDELDGLVIRFWHNWSGLSGEVITALVEDFNLNNPWGILAVEIYQGNLDELGTKLSQDKDSDHRPNLIVGYLHQAQAWDEEAGLVDLNDYLLDPVWGYSEDEQADFFPVFWEFDISREKRLGIPAQRSGNVLYYNQGWARELGFPSAPLSSDDFLEQACAAAQFRQADHSTVGTGGWLISTEYPAIVSWMHAFGGKFYQKKTKTPSSGEYQFDQPAVIEAYEFLRELYDQGCAWLPENPYPETYFAERKALFASGSITEMPYFLDAMRRAGNNDPWTVLAYLGPDGAQVMDVYGTAFQVLRSDEKQQLAAWLLIKWLLQAENQARLVQSTYAFPLRMSAMQADEQLSARASALDLLQFAQTEPTLPSWSLVRWAISDSATQLFRSYTTLDQVPALVRYLDQTANDLHSMINEEK